MDSKPVAHNLRGIGQVFSPGWSPFGNMYRCLGLGCVCFRPFAPRKRLQRAKGRGKEPGTCHLWILTKGGQPHSALTLCSFLKTPQPPPEQPMALARPVIEHFNSPALTTYLVFFSSLTQCAYL